MTAPNIEKDNSLNKKIYAIPAAILICMLGASPAVAEDSIKNDPNKVTALSEDYSRSSLVLDSVVSGMPKARASNWTLNGALAASKTSKITPPNGTAGNVVTKFSSNLVGNYFGTVVSVTGSSSAKWLGITPLNASSVSLTDTIWANSLGITSVNVGSGASVGLSVTGNTVSISNTVSSAWQNNHYYSGLEFSGLLLNVNQSATATYRFGSTSFVQVVN